MSCVDCHEPHGANIHQRTTGLGVQQRDAVCVRCHSEQAGPHVFEHEALRDGCMACHNSGVAGSPKIGDKDAWADRIAQGMDLLYEHAIVGFQGKAGYMPPKGGFAHLSDDDVKLAVDYMVEQSQ